MGYDFEDRPLITHANINEFFQETVHTALSNQNIRAADHTIHYLVNLLTGFVRAEALYDRTPDGVMIRPLAMVYGDALEAATAAERNLALRRLGDVALFIAGLFADSLNRKVVDVDYYIAMGGNAYGHLSEVMRGSQQGRVFCEVFEELSARFTEFVDVLADVSDRARLGGDQELMRSYELWLRTGSRRAARRLRAAGIEPTPSSRLSH